MNLNKVLGSQILSKQSTHGCLHTEDGLIGRGLLERGSKDEIMMNCGQTFHLIEILIVT